MENKESRTFEINPKIEMKKVRFTNRYGITLAGELYLPDNYEDKKNPAVIVAGPFGAVKEQASGLYAQELAARGFVSIAFDPSFGGESGGEVRNTASPDIFTEDYSAAVDYIGLLPYVDRERIGAVGICGLSVSKAGWIDTLSGSDSETIIVKIADLLSSQGAAAAILAGIILAGILAATMSTADSQLLAASSSVSQNLLRDTFGINLSEKASLIAARITVILISVIAVFLARDPSSSVFGIVSFAWAGFGAAFGPVMLCALFWKRSNKYGAFASMLSGGIMIFVWKYLVRPMGGALDIYELLPAFLIALAFNITVSLLTEKPDAAMEAEFDNAIRS